jgi:hypothetical protein
MFTNTVIPLVATLAGPAEPQPLIRAEVVTTDGSSILYAYDDNDDVAAEIVVSFEGLQASFNGLFVDARLADDGTVMSVQCGGQPCTEADRLTAEAQLATVNDVLVRSEPQALRLRCALTIALGAGACAAGGVAGGLACLAGYYLAACECMDEVIVGGKNICAEDL